MTLQVPAPEALELDQPAAVALYPPGAVIGPRRLADYELVMLVSGSATLTLDQSTVELAPGSWVLARPGMVDHYQWDPLRSSRHYHLHFSLLGPVDANDWAMLRHWPNAAGMPAAFRQLVWLSTDLSSPVRRLLARTYLWLLLCSFLTGLTEGAHPEPRPVAPLASALEHVRRRWETEGFVPVSRAELADAAGVSPAHLSRLFAAEFGLGPARGLEWVRLLRARSLLERSGMSVGSIAQSCGFADQYHLSHRFRAAFGTAPSAWRAATTAAGEAASGGSAPGAGTLGSWEFCQCGYAV